MQDNDIENKKDEVDDMNFRNTKNQPEGFSKYIYITFFWCLMGATIIYGFRLYHNAPPHPSFIPIIGGVFAAVLSFTLVMALEYAIGPITFELGKNFSFKGASGPIILWCMCFFVICLGLYMLGLADVANMDFDAPKSECSFWGLLVGKCT